VGLSYGWDIRSTYDNLWSAYEDAVNDGVIDVGVVAEIEESFDLVINSIPRPVLCYKGHDFTAQDVIAAGDAPDLGIDISNQFRCDDETIICNGEESPSWYRLSRVFGHTTVEWPNNKQGFVPVATASTVRKPVWTNCDCWPHVEHVGRYGEWAKGVLSHDAYNKAHLRVSHELLKAER